MMKTHQFTPVMSEENFKQTIRYIAGQSMLLAQKVIGDAQKLDIDTLTIFSQSDGEYDFISRFIRKYGAESPFSHGETLYISSNLDVDGHVITFLGVRKPDNSRIEIGYGDYPADNYAEILKNIAANKFAAEITTGRDQKLIELKHPDFDVRGYIVPSQLHDDGIVRRELTELS